MKKVSVILPTYNEAGNIVRLIKAIVERLKKNNFQPEIIIIDDNSPDKTADKVKQLIPKYPVKLFARTERGLATAVHLGIKKSRGKITILMDTDFNHQPKDLPRLIKPIMDKKADLVIGSRYIKGGGMNTSNLQFLASKYGNFLVNQIVLGLPVHESLSGFLAFDKKVLKNLNLQQIFQGYGEYCIRLLYHVFKQGYSLAEVPVVYGKRRYGQSKSKLFKMMIDYFITALKLKLNL